MQKKKLLLKVETIRTLTSLQISGVHGGLDDGTQTEKASIVYWCPTNTSIQRSCASPGCGPSEYYVCPMMQAGSP